MIAGGLIRALGAWAVAVLIAYLAATTFATMAVVLSLHNLGAPVAFLQGLRMIAHDWLAMTGIFLPVIALGFAIAMPVAGGLGRWKPDWRSGLFAAAGAAALVAVHLALKASFGITPIAVARSLPGLASQALAGACGGWACATLRAHWR
jgi:hypothetical protein